MLKGTKFQVIVWKYLKTIPKGQTRTYKEVAKAIKRPLSYRAVANAIAKNPIRPSFHAIELLNLTVLLEDILEKVVSKQKVKLLKSEGILL